MKILEVIIAFSIFFYLEGEVIMTADDVLNNLLELIGKPFDYDDVVCAFEDYEENQSL